MRKTIIVCTLGPATDKDNVLEELIKNGLNVARCNFSHGSHEEHLGRMNKVKELREKCNKPVAILLDTKGPEIRTGNFENGKVHVFSGQTFTLVGGEKIENSEGILNIDSIIEAADGIMVARGDMGVELPEEEVPIIQKMIIKKVYQAGKKVITATQMLDSMMNNPRPTRAETTDVANAIYDGTSAIMLSGETAAGKYPIDALQTMVRIAERTEMDINYKQRFFNQNIHTERNITQAVCHATCTTAYDLEAKAILTVTKSGRSARMISSCRPDCMVIAGTTDEKTCRQLSLSWGVTPVLLKEKEDVLELFDYAVEVAKENKLVNQGDIVVITSGVPLGTSGTTNMMKVQTVE